MSVFNKDIIEKDLSLENIFRDKIITRIKHIVYNINECSRRGILDFPRVTKPGTYGKYDNSREWHDRYSALYDYVTLSFKEFQSELTQSPLIHDKANVYVDNIKCYNGYSGGKLDKDKITVIIGCHKVVKKDTFLCNPEYYVYQFNFDIPLDPPTNFRYPEFVTAQFTV